MNVHRRTVEIDAVQMARTKSAILILDSDDQQHWLPLSQIKILEEEDVDAGEEPLVKLEIPEWLAIKERLV